MKKNVLTATLMALLLSFVFVSCDKEDDDLQLVTKKPVDIQFVAKGGDKSTRSTVGTIFSWFSTYNIQVTDFILNIGDIELEFDDDYDYHKNGKFDDDYNPFLTFNGTYDGDDELKLKGPFEITLISNGKLNTNMVIKGIQLPMAAYSGIEFKMKKSKDKTSVMYGKSILIKGTIGDTPFEFASDKSFDFEIDYPDNKPFVVGENQDLVVSFDLDKLFANKIMFATFALDKVIEIDGKTGFYFYYFDDDDDKYEWFEKTHKWHYEFAKKFWDWLDDILDDDWEDDDDD
ncbi:MAG TPA: hypothetical protein GXZ56_11920 [Bacteroidales bacterium]|nr:hypothetical protein [Bacteroidales bacterium]